jgi:hypothetical protein
MTGVLSDNRRATAPSPVQLHPLSVASNESMSRCGAAPG